MFSWARGASVAGCEVRVGSSCFLGAIAANAVGGVGWVVVGTSKTSETSRESLALTLCTLQLVIELLAT